MKVIETPAPCIMVQLDGGSVESPWGAHFG
jgi:hypothetical protein